MDYLQLKKTLIAAFDHFLSCHDINELEEMMQAFEVGKSLVIKLPEPIDREDYRDDAFTHEEQTKSDDAFTHEEQTKSDDVLRHEYYKDDVITHEDYKDDVAMMEAPKPKKIMSRMRRTKPKNKPNLQKKQIKICDLPILMDLSVLSKQKQKALRDVIESGEHHITFEQVMVYGNHAMAMAKVHRVISDTQPLKRDDIIAQAKENILSQKIHHSDSDELLRQDLIEKIKHALGHNKKAKPP